jgi:hypothetical protein
LFLRTARHSPNNHDFTEPEGISIEFEKSVDGDNYGIMKSKDNGNPAMKD